MKKCDFCDEMFDNNRIYANHVRWKHKSSRCKICNKPTKNVLCNNCIKYECRFLCGNFVSKYGNSCSKCATKLKPQCNSIFWTEDRKLIHSNKIKNSKIYRDGIKSRNTAGTMNGMFGKSHSIESRKKCQLPE